MFRVENRRASGLVETAFKQLIADKTNWRTMLKENQPDMDLAATAEELKARLELDAVEEQASDITSISYHVLEFPKTVRSHNLDKHSVVEGTLMGIKGQHLMFDTGVINVRKFSSYEVEADN